MGGGARWPVPGLEPLRAELGLGYQSSDGMLFVCTGSSCDSTEIGNDRFGGIRAALGAGARLGAAELALEGAATFGPGSWWEIAIGGDYTIWEGLSAGLRLGGEWREIALDVDGVDATIRDTQLGGQIAIGYRL